MALIIGDVSRLGDDWRVHLSNREGCVAKGATRGEALRKFKADVLPGVHGEIFFIVYDHLGNTDEAWRFVEGIGKKVEIDSWFHREQAPVGPFYGRGLEVHTRNSDCPEPGSTG